MLLAIVSLTAALLIGAGAWRLIDSRADQAAWAGLQARQPKSPEHFTLSMIAGLPAAAQRYFRQAIAPGTPLHTVAELSMAGEFSLGTQTEPNYQQLRAEQILAAPEGFVWRARVGRGLWFSGSDGACAGRSWTRFRLLGLMPVAHAGNNPDHFRAAFGRYVAEAVFWTPAALLPSDTVRWEAVDATTARVTVRSGRLEQAVDLTVGATGQLSQVVVQRWSDANPERRYQLQPFGARAAEYREFGGFSLPTQIEAGHFFGTAAYFALFKVNIFAIRFPARPEGQPAALR